MSITTTREDPVVAEVTATLREWHQIWSSLYLDDQTELFEQIGSLISDCIDAREELISLLNKLQNENLEQNLSDQVILKQQIACLKAELVGKLDHGNQLLNLDLVLRDGDFKPVDPVELSPIKLYQLHVESTNSDLIQSNLSNGHQFYNSQESSSVTGSNFYSTASQTGSDITNISSTNGHQRSYHLQFSLNQHNVSFLPQDEQLELYFSVIDNNRSTSSAQPLLVSDKFLVKARGERIIEGHTRTVFANIGPLSGRELGILVQIYRRGRMILADSSKSSSFGTKQQSNSNLNHIQEGLMNTLNNAGSRYSSSGLSRSRHSTIGDLFPEQLNYRRPFGTSFISLVDHFTRNKNPTKEFNVITKVVLVQNESDFSQLSETINPSKRSLNAKSSSNQPSIQLDLSLKVLICKQESIPRMLSFDVNEYCLTGKRDFPDVVMPGDFMNDLYLCLEGAEFEKGGKSIPKNIEASISLIDRSGLVIENCIVPSSNCDKLSIYKSCIYYHSNSPRWNESVKINVPLVEFDKAHIRIEFRHCSTKEREKKFLGFCFLPLSDQDGTVIPDKTHELYLYKCDSQIWEDDTLDLCKYTTLPYGPGSLHNSNTSSTSNLVNSGSNTLKATNQSSNINANNANGSFVHNNREIVTVNTFLLSTKLTQNRILLNLLKWRELIKRNNKDFEDTLNKVLTLEGEEIVKFLQDILDTLFDTFTLSLSNEDSYSALIFKVLVNIFLLLDDPKYLHFRPVLDTYASAHFSATLVYKGLLACVLACVKKCLESSSSNDMTWQAPIQKCFKTIKYVFQFIVQSKLLYSQATGDQTIDEHFLMDLRRLFKLFETMLLNVDKKLMPLQETFLESFPGALEQLIRVMEPLELAKVVNSLAGSVGFHLPPSLSRSKLIFMREIAQSSLLKKQEARIQISEIFCKHLEIYLMNFERLELCHEVLESLVLRIHDFHWPAIHKSYLQMLKGKSPLNSNDADITKGFHSSVMTVGEINLYSRISSPIQANQLDLALIDISRELKPFVELMEPLLKLLDRLVRDLNSDRPIIQRYCSCLLTILKLMSKNSFDSFLSNCHKIDYSNLCDLFKSLRAVYNRDWSTMQLISHAIFEHPIDEISRDDRMKINQNPNSYINLIVDFITHPTLQLESFSSRKRQYILEVFGDLRLKFTDQLIRFWNGLGKENHCDLIGTSIQSFLNASLLPCDELQEKLVLVFYDMIDAEHSQKSNFRQIERCMIDNLDLHFNLDRGDSRFIGNFDRILKEKMIERSPVWKAKGAKLIDSFTKLMRLLVDYRQSLESYDNKSRQMICLVELLSFYKELDRMEIYLKYLFKLCDIHLESDYFTEAAFTLKLYADELRWCNRVLTSLEGFRPEEQEWRRKEILYQRIIEYFDLGKCWEESISLCKELASFYENFLVDYEKLSAILKRLTQLLDNILNEHRPEREYFRVEYLGSDLPNYIRNKEFIYRGGEYERLATFIQRVLAEFPDAKVLNNKGKNALAKDCAGQFLAISNVKPVPFLQDTFKTGQRIVNDKIIQYYLNNRLDTFSYDIPIVKTSSYEQSSAKQQDGANGKQTEGSASGGEANQVNMRNLWVGRCMLKIRKQLPDILPWSEVVSQDYIEISPITNAIETISSMNVELSKLILNFSKDPSRPLSPLTMRLQGVLEASVNGGPVVIMNAFFRRDKHQSSADGQAGSATTKQPDYESLMKLRNLIRQQFTLLESGLSLHCKLAPAEVMPLHARLVERLDVLKRTFNEESSQMIEENNYETLNHVSSSAASRKPPTASSKCPDSGETVSSMPTGCSSAASSNVGSDLSLPSGLDEVDTCQPVGAARCDQNGNIYGDLEGEPQATYALPVCETAPGQHLHNGASQSQTLKQQPPTQSRATGSLFTSNGASSYLPRSGDTSRPPSSSPLVRPNHHHHYALSSSSSSLSTLAILSNLPTLNAASQQHQHGGGQHKQHSKPPPTRISLTPTKELLSVAAGLPSSSMGQEVGSSSTLNSGRAARRLTFDSHRMIGPEMGAKSSGGSRPNHAAGPPNGQENCGKSTASGQARASVAGDGLQSGAGAGEAPPLPPRIFHPRQHDGANKQRPAAHQQQQQSPGRSHAALVGSPTVPSRHSAPHSAMVHLKQQQQRQQQQQQASSGANNRL